MITEVDKVRSSGGDEWEYNCPMPETLDEAVDTYGDATTLAIFKSGLKVKIQAVAREAFRNGKARDEVEEMAANYRPGETRKSAKKQALDLITDNAGGLENDPTLKDEVKTAFANNQWGKVIELLT